MVNNLHKIAYSQNGKMPNKNTVQPYTHLNFFYTYISINRLWIRNGFNLQTLIHNFILFILYTYVSIPILQETLKKIFYFTAEHYELYVI